MSLPIDPGDSRLRDDPRPPVPSRSVAGGIAVALVVGLLAGYLLFGQADQRPRPRAADPADETIKELGTPENRGAFRLLALIDRANKSIRAGRGLDAWFDELSYGQKSAIILNQIPDGPQEFIYGGSAKRLKFAIWSLREDVATPPSRRYADELARIEPLLTPEMIDLCEPSRSFAGGLTEAQTNALSNLDISIDVVEKSLESYREALVRDIHLYFGRALRD